MCNDEWPTATSLHAPSFPMCTRIQHVYMHANTVLFDIVIECGSLLNPSISLLRHILLSAQGLHVNERNIHYVTFIVKWTTLCILYGILNSRNVICEYCKPVHIFNTKQSHLTDASMSLCHHCNRVFSLLQDALCSLVNRTLSSLVRKFIYLLQPWRAD